MTMQLFAVVKITSICCNKAPHLVELVDMFATSTKQEESVVELGT